MNSNTVSVIIPVFNRGKSLREAVMSALLQSYEKLEIIIVDDGSTDDTNQVAKELALKWSGTIRVYTQKNSGPGPARELGTINSCGEYIQFLDSDDILLPYKLEEQVKSLRINPQSGISYGISYQADYSFNPPLVSGPIRSTGERINYLFPKLLNERWWTTSNPLYRRSIIQQVGPWRDLINEEDWEFDARAARLHTSLEWVNIGVSIRRINMSDDHLSFGGCTDGRKIADRVIAKELLYGYALSGGIKSSDPEMITFAKECFLLSRQCAVIGLENESSRMFKLSRKASLHSNKHSVTYFLYGILVYFFGWVRTGRVVSRLRNML
jgi:glycosyltransferase involved in cell wall biosynthesis